MGSIVVIKKTLEFDRWYQSVGEKTQTQIDARLERIQNESHFGDAKYLDEGLIELRWKNGYRVYFFKESSTGIVLLLGGIKNAQKKDIQRARLLLRKYTRLEA